MPKSGKEFSDWDTVYKDRKIETMPWYDENFDSDLEKELDERRTIKTINNDKFLDLGTGPATQAIWPAKRGVLQRDIANFKNFSAPTISWHMPRLVKGSLLSTENGRQCSILKILKA